jgi:hypothetical protein
MRPQLFVWVLVAGCGPNDVVMQDLAPPPQDMSMPGCMPDFGRAFFVDKLEYLPSSEGFDLTGDGMIDNRTGSFGPLANGELVKSIGNGATIILMSMVGLKGPPLVEGDTPSVAIYVGLDADTPANPANNTMNGEFKVPLEQLDVNCMSTTNFDSSKVESGSIRSTSRKIDVVAGTIGTITFVDTVQISTPDSPGDFGGWSGRIGGVVPACSLSLTPFPGNNPASLLDVIVNVLTTQPDIDRDGDGIETFIGDGTGIKECVDGDGTVIPGRTCPCDPRMQDAYSGALGFHIVAARIIGLVTSQ